MGAVRDALRSRRVPGYVFARKLEKRLGEGRMSEHRLNKLLSGRIKGVTADEIHHIAEELVAIGAPLSEQQVKDDLDRISRDRWEDFAKTA